MSPSLELSIVVPTHNAATEIADTLPAILASDLPRDSFEIIVVDDASSDASATVAARYADTVVRLSGPLAGAAYARNRGAELARGELVAFVDADVRLEPGTLPGMIATLNARPTVGAVSASHGDSRSVAGFVSRYWNLLVRFGEETHGKDSALFTSACGVVRRSIFFSSGMYDEWRFATGCLDGVELAHRLHALGYRTVLTTNFAISRLARWSFGSVLTEVWRRSQLLARSLGYQRTRAESRGEVVFTLTDSLIPALAILGVVAVSSAFVIQPIWWAKIAIIFSIIMLANLRFHRFIVRTHGPGLAIAVAPLHFVVQLVAIAGLCAGRALRDAVGDRAPDAKTQAYSEVGVEMWPPVPRRT